MANKPKKRTRTNPELRTPKTQRRERRASRDTRIAHAPQGPPLRVRPDGVAGVVALVLGAAPIFALVLGAGLFLNRWFSYSWPDSAWLYIAFATLVAGPAVGYVARARRDVTAFAIVGGALSLVALVVERVAGPDHCHGDDCAAFGALGAWGPFWSVVVIVACAAAGWGLGVWLLSFVEGRRKDAGRRSTTITVLTMLMLGVMLGIPLAATLVGIDALVRKQPRLAIEAASLTSRYCFTDFVATPPLAVRPDPTMQLSFDHRYLVHRTNEKRPAVGGGALKGFPGTGEAQPYEALVSFDGNGDPVDVLCRKVAPGSGNASASDMAAPKNIGSQLGSIESPNPGQPPFLQQSGSGTSTPISIGGGTGGTSAPVAVR